MQYFYSILLLCAIFSTISLLTISVALLYLADLARERNSLLRLKKRGWM